MSLTPKNFEHLVTYFCDNVVTVDGDYLRITEEQARADLAAMRTPITAKALKADGWMLLDNGVYSLNDSYLSMYVHLFSDGPVVTYRARRLPNVSNMYDLRELVRLLGQKQDEK